VASNGSATADGNQQLKNNGNADVSVKGNNASAVPIPSSLLGIGGYAPPAHITGLQSYMIHQGIPQPLASPNSGVPQFGSFQSQSTIQPNLHWANQQEVQNVSQPQDETNFQPSQSDQTSLQPGANSTDELSSKPSKTSHPDHLNAHGKQQQSPASVPAESTHELTKTSQVVEQNVAEHVVYDEQQKAFKEQDSPSNVNSRTGMVEHQEKKTESKVFILLCDSCLVFNSICECLTLSSLMTTRMKELQLTSNLSLYLGSSINLQIFLHQLPRFTSKIMQQSSILML
jgi:hypothetical protein